MIATNYFHKTEPNEICPIILLLMTFFYNRALLSHHLEKLPPASDGNNR